MNRAEKNIILGVAISVVVGVALAIILRKKKPKTDKTKNYIVGDSQSPFIDRNSTRASLINSKGGKSSLWEGGKGLSWLKSAVEEYPVSPDVNSIIINIGTNGGFNVRDDIRGLVESIKSKFPNAELYAVKGSWGWGGNKNISESKVNDYYSKFKELGVDLIEPAIGKVNDPHGNLPVYKTIGANIDKSLA